MTLIQLQYFLAVCKYENFTRAAENFNISQPAISGAIRELERECGVALFNRDKNALRITDEGRVLRDEAELVLKQYGQLDDIVKNLSTSRKFIRVSFSTLSGNQVYPKLLRVFTELRKTGDQKLCRSSLKPSPTTSLDSTMMVKALGSAFLTALCMLYISFELQAQSTMSLSLPE